jgi:hypothetical protein
MGWFEDNWASKPRIAVNLDIRTLGLERLAKEKELPIDTQDPGISSWRERRAN